MDRHSSSQTSPSHCDNDSCTEPSQGQMLVKWTYSYYTESPDASGALPEESEPTSETSPSTFRNQSPGHACTNPCHLANLPPGKMLVQCTCSYLASIDSPKPEMHETQQCHSTPECPGGVPPSLDNTNQNDVKPSKITQATPSTTATAPSKHPSEPTSISSMPSTGRRIVHSRCFQETMNKSNNAKLFCGTRSAFHAAINSPLSSPCPLASSSRISSQSAWTNGPPLTSSSASSRSQSPVPNIGATPISASYFRRTSNLGQGVNIKEGISVPHNNVGSTRQGSPVIFCSIDDVSALISSSPAATPAVKIENVKTFGPTTSNQLKGKAPSASVVAPSKQTSRSVSVSSMPLTTAVTTSASSASMSTPTTTASSKPAIMAKADIAKLFQSSGSTSAPSQAASDTPSPSIHPSNLPPPHLPPPTSSSPQHAAPTSAQSQFGSRQFQPYSQGSGLRPQQNGAPNNTPRSPTFPRPMPNGSSGGPPRSNGPGAQIPPSSRLAHHAIYPHQGQPSGMHPQHSPPRPHNGMPMSPHNQPPPLPGTPTMAHDVPNPANIPHPAPSHQPSSSINISSPPPTPPSSTPAGCLNTNAYAFVQGPRTSKVVIKAPDGNEVNLESFVHKQSPSSGSPSGASNRRSTIRIESEESKRKRLEDQKEKECLERQKKDSKESLRKEAKAHRKKEKEERRREEEEEEEEERIHDEGKNERLQKEEERERVQKQHLRTAMSTTDDSSEGIPPANPTAIAIARLSRLIDRIELEKPINGPKVELHVNPKDCKFWVDRESLLQLFRGGIDVVPPLDERTVSSL